MHWFTFEKFRRAKTSKPFKSDRKKSSGKSSGEVKVKLKVKLFALDQKPGCIMCLLMGAYFSSSGSSSSI